MIYEVSIKAATLSAINPRSLVLGAQSLPKRITMQPNCEKIQTLQRKTEPEYDMAMLAAVVLSLFGLLFIIIAIVLWR